MLIKKYMFLVYKSLKYRKFRFVLTCISISLGMILTIIVTSFFYNMSRDMNKYVIKNPNNYQVTIYNINNDDKSEKDLLFEDIEYMVSSDYVEKYRIIINTTKIISEVNGSNVENYSFNCIEYYGVIILDSDFDSAQHNINTNIENKNILNKSFLDDLDIDFSNTIQNVKLINVDGIEEIYTIDLTIDDNIQYGPVKINTFSIPYTGNTKNIFADSVSIQINDISKLEQLENKVSERGFYYESNTVDIENQKKMIKIIFILSIVFAIIVILSTSLSIRNTINLSINEKVRYIGLLKMFGYEDIKLKVLFIIESVFYVLFAIPLSIFTSYLIVYFGKNQAINLGLSDEFISFFRLNFYAVIICQFIAVTVAILISISPVKYINRIEITDALKYDGFQGE